MPKVVAQKFPARGRAVEMGGKNLEKTLNSSNFRFFSYFRKTFKNPHFRLTVTAKNRCFSV